MSERAPFKYKFIRTPIQEPAVRLRGALDWRRLRHPELRELHREDGRMLRILRSVLRPDTNCIDIGCHYGSMLSRMTRLAPKGQHVAFEPTPAKVRFLKKKFPDVTIVETALGDEAGEVTFWVNNTQTGFSGLQRQGQGEFTSLRVQCGRLDDLVPRDRRFGFVKVDVEGAELLVFRGAADFFARDRPYLLFECGPSGPSAFGFESADLYREVVAMGYEIFTARRWLESTRPVNEAEFLQALEYPYEAFNWFASPA